MTKSFWWSTLRVTLAFAAALALVISWGLAFTAKERRESSLMQNARDIGLMLYDYAQDHDGRYPEGATSTEVFQKLVDGGYVFDSDGDKADLSIFYARMPGKTPATSRQLRPENVSWDVTVPLTENSPNLPAVFLTGYRLVYKAAAPPCRAAGRHDPGATGRAIPITRGDSSSSATPCKAPLFGETTPMARSRRSSRTILSRAPIHTGN